MSFINNRNLLKASGISLVLASALLTACDNKSASTDDTAVDVADKTITVSPAEVKTTATAEKEEVLVMTTLGVDAVNNMVFSTLINGKNLTAEQKTCLQSRDKNLGQTELQEFYKNNFSSAELKELDNFYSSAVGQKMLAYGKEEMLLRNGMEVASPMAEPSAEEMAEIEAFIQSPVGKKYSQINVAVGEGSALATLDKPIDAEFKRCNIDLNMATLMQPTAS